MSQQDKLSGESSARFDPQSLLTTPIGLSTPFFLAYYSAASVGAAFWWMSRFARYTHLEAVMAKTPVAPEPVLEAAPASEPEVLVEAVEVVAEPVSEAPALVAAPEAEAAPSQPKLAVKPRVRKAKATA